VVVAGDSRGFFDAHGELLEAIHLSSKGFQTKRVVNERLNSLGNDLYKQWLQTIGTDINRFEE
jgi:hypothetical protein